MEDITDVDFMHTKIVCKDFKLKNLGKYQDLLCSKWFNNIRKMCIEIYELDPAYFLSAQGLALKAASKKTKL